MSDGFDARRAPSGWRCALMDSQAWRSARSIRWTRHHDPDTLTAQIAEFFQRGREEL
jgi:hypothetical protein